MKKTPQNPKTEKLEIVSMFENKWVQMQKKQKKPKPETKKHVGIKSLKTQLPDEKTLLEKEIKKKLETNFRHHYEKLKQLEAEFQKELKEDSSKDWRGDEPGYKELTAKINLLRKNIEEQEKVTLRAEEEIYKNTLRVRSLAQK